jgi:DNA N-6-adenine-methyltransferase (Dam)
MLLFDLEQFTAEPSDTTDTDQRYTPPGILRSVELVLGSIGLDPTANPRKTVPALHHITERQNTFTTDWEPLLQEKPTAFMNPPYSNTAPFLRRWCEYVRSGAIDAGITLTLAGVLANKSTQPMIKELAIAVCHPFGRINFIGGGQSNDRDVVFILWGGRADVAKFERELEGMVLTISR